MEIEYFYSKEKDSLLESYIEELSSIQDEKGQVAFLGSLPTQTLYELSSFSKWKLAEARKALQEAQDNLQSKKEEEERRFEEAILYLENGITGGIFAGEA